MYSEKIQRLRIINFVCKTCIMQRNYGEEFSLKASVSGEEFQFKGIG